ncbi:MAG: ketopantoate reductase family protein [Candidatus Omnitrophica bacterium]|nr:ketopantoate reductase family protein [Candidatus Omnitrophota bacterium]MDD5592129.1 ketopantoate reductase family protein [Candidatus Omnitrophota bacterium]
MKIAVIGAGAIGNLVAGYLKLKGLDVFLIGYADSVKAIREKGLRISGVRGDFNIKVDVSDKLNSKPELVILTTKTQDLGPAVKENMGFIKDAVVLTTQNGVQAENIVSQYIPKENIISSIVMFGATYLEPAKVVHNFEGNWIIGRIFSQNDETLLKISEVLNKIFPAIITQDLQGMKYLKIFVNANNCIPAILGKSMQEAFSDIAVSRISIGIWKEGLEIIACSGIKLVSLPDFPLERLTKLASLPLEEAAGIFSGIMTNLSQEPLYGSILQSIKRNRASEIDYINGEFVRLAEDNKLDAPLNRKLVEMVHEVEKAGRFFTKEELLRRMKGMAG